MLSAKTILITVVTCVLITFFLTYYRVYVAGTFVVRYEMLCNSIDNECRIAECFIEEDGCVLEGEHVVVMEKNARDLRSQCGSSIVDCNAAMRCLESDTHCRIDASDVH